MFSTQKEHEVNDLPIFTEETAEFDDDDYNSDEDDDLQISWQLPDTIRNFVLFLHKYYTEKSVEELTRSYESHFQALTMRYFKATPWPPAEAIAHLVNSDRRFLTFYRQIYHRHIQEKLVPTLEQRISSWNNFQELFSVLLAAKTPEEVNVELPAVWLWDIVDDFVNQLQSFCMYRAKASNKAELEALQDKVADIWNFKKSLGYLEQLVEKSKIKAVLQSDTDGSAKIEDGTFASHPVYLRLGFFSLIGLLRLHCITGNYELALNSVAAVHLINNAAFYKSQSRVHTSFSFHLAFSLLMSRRIHDATAVLTAQLIHNARTLQFYSQSPSYDFLVRYNDKMLAMLALCSMLSAIPLDEQLQKQVQQRWPQVEGGTPEFFFHASAPLFVTAEKPSDEAEEGTAGYAKAALRAQLKVFLWNVTHLRELATVRSFLKLYTSIKISKLASYLKKSEEETRALLKALSDQTKEMTFECQLRDSVFTNTDTVTFQIDDNDSVNVTVVKQKQHPEIFFSNQIQKLSDILAH